MKRKLLAILNIFFFLLEAICMCVYIVQLPPDTLPPWRQFGWRKFDLRPIGSHDQYFVVPSHIMYVAVHNKIIKLFY